MIYINGKEAKVLFDPCSTHSYVSPAFGKMLSMQLLCFSLFFLIVATLVGKKVVCGSYFPNCEVKIANLTMHVGYA